MGKTFPIKATDTEKAQKSTAAPPALAVGRSRPWTPIVTEKKTGHEEVTEGDEKFLNYGERMPKKTKTEKRSFQENDGTSGNTVPMEMNSAEDDGKFITVQLFPIRLADVFEKAERYARLTLFPMLTEQFSNIFKSTPDTNETASANERSDKPIILSSGSRKNEKYQGHENDNEESQRNFRSIQKTSMKMLDEIKPPIEKLMNNYNNYHEVKANKDTYKIKIDLPTYAPPTEKPKKFIPIHGEKSPEVLVN